MKNSILIAIVAVLSVSISSMAQIINVFKNGSMRQHKVTALSASGIMTEVGEIKNEDIDSIQTVKRGVYSNDLDKRYSVANWKMNVVSPIVVSPEVSAQVNDREWRSFKAQRNTGKVVQMLGVVALGTGLYIVMDRYNKALDAATNHQTPPKASKYPIILAAGGAGFFVIGIAIDISASDHLPSH
jgi:hypothetical protein